jgi:hypothetical protein
MTMKIVYYWKELTEDGLLKEPADIGPYYNEDSFNGWYGFVTKEEALKRLDEIFKEHSDCVCGKYVLVKTYRKN